MYDLPIATGFYTSQILPLAAQNCINLIPIVVPVEGALNRRALLGRPGLTQFSSGVSGECRGACKFNEIYYTLNGTTLKYIDSSGTATTVTGSVGGSGRVSIAVNDDYIVIVNNLGEGYYSDGSTVTKITDGDFLDASTVCFVDGYFVFSEKNGTRFFLSGINDPSSFSATDRSTAEERPDRITAVYTYNNLLHVAGTETTEKFNNIGGVSFPFVRINQASNSVGCFAPYSPIELENAYAFIGGGVNEGAQVYLMSGGQAQVISTPAIDNALQQFTDDEISEAYTMVYQDRGQHILIIQVYSDVVDDVTFCYNATSGEWFQMASGEGNFRGKSITRIYSKFLVGDDSNKVGYFDWDAFTDYGDAIEREKTSQPFFNQNGDEFRIGRLELWCEAGAGSATTDPQVMMSFSDDLGKTFGNEHWRGIGKVGKYNQRCIWRKQGYVPRDRVYKFRFTDPYKFNVMKLTAA